MTPDDGLFEDMSIPLQGPARSLSVDEDTASRMLDGSITASDAPPEYARVADVLAAASAPPTSAELAGEDGVRATFRAARAARRAVPTRAARSRVLVLAAAIASLIALGGLAAAVSGSFDAASDTSGGNGSSSSTDDRGRGASTRSDADDDADDDADETAAQAGGPEATGPAAVGLCRAYGSGQGDKAHARAFRALAAAASTSLGSTDAERIAAYCTTVIAAAEAPTTAPSGPPADPGGNGGGNGNAGGNGGGGGNSNAGGNGGGSGNSNAGGNGGGSGNSNAGGNGNGGGSG